LVHDRRRGLTDRAALGVVGDVADDVAVQVNAQRDLVAARRVDVVHLGVAAVAQPGAVRVLVVVEDDLLVESIDLRRIGHRLTLRSTSWCATAPRRACRSRPRSCTGRTTHASWTAPRSTRGRAWRSGDRHAPPRPGCRAAGPRR